MAGRGLWQLPLPPEDPSSWLPCWDQDKQALKWKNAQPPWHLPGSRPLLRARQGRRQKPPKPSKLSNWLGTHQLLERRLGLNPRPPAVSALRSACTPAGKEGFPPQSYGQRFPDKQSKRRAVKGSAEVPSLQIFPVSFWPCFHHQRGTQPGLRVVCLIWLEFPPPPTWHSPHSPKHSRPGVLTSTPSAGLGAHATGHSGAPGRGSRQTCRKGLVGKGRAVVTLW